jgi:hypothetical protein
MSVPPWMKASRLAWMLLLAGVAVLSSQVFAASCITQSQMAAAQRDALSSAAKAMLVQMQNGDVQALQANTLPAVATDFSGIAASVQNLKPLMHNATLTVNNIFILDASTQTAGATKTDFYCGEPVVSFNFTDLPAGTYALAIAHVTGVPQPQQIAIILAKSPPEKWLLAGLFNKPMIFEGHDGLWYWASARRYSQQNGNWAAWFYYRIANNLLNPLEIMSTPNLEKLQAEIDKTKPANLPGATPASLTTRGATYSVTAIDTTNTFGALDLDVHYTPNAAQAAQLHDPPSARKQVIDVMSALLEQHPELHQAFHGMWVHADQGQVSLFALELPMDGIAGSPATTPPSIH